VIAIIGSGTVGRAVGKCFSRYGFDVVFYDINGNVLKDLKREGYKTVSSLHEALAMSKVSFVTVPTPTVSGRFNDSYVKDTIAKALKVEQKVGSHVMAVKSTVLPGVVEKLIRSARKMEFCVNPEFMRSEFAEIDFESQDVIIGRINGHERAADVLKELYEEFRSRSKNEFEIIVTDSNTACMIKYVSNLLLATKISLFNEIDEVCKKLGVNTRFVLEHLVSDRIPTVQHYLRDFLRYGFRDECLPKDLGAFITFADELGVEVSLLKEVERVNRRKVNEGGGYS